MFNIKHEFLEFSRRAMFQNRTLSGAGDDLETATGLNQIIDCCPYLDEVEIADWTERL